MMIGEAASLTGLPPKTLRYYEDVGLVIPSRDRSGFRNYSEENLLHLRLVSGARTCGFTLDECREMLAAYTRVACNGTCSEELEPVIRRIREKIIELNEMERQLGRVVGPYIS